MYENLAIGSHNTECAWLLGCIYPKEVEKGLHLYRPANVSIVEVWVTGVEVCIQYYAEH